MMFDRVRAFIKAHVALVAVSSVLILAALTALLGYSCTLSGRATEGLNFVLLEDGTYGVRSGEARGKKEIVVPATHLGAPVTKVLNNFFDNIPNQINTQHEYGDREAWQTVTESVVLPDGIVEICDDAFYGAKSLRSINIPKTVRVIGERAFELSGLANVEIAEGSVLEEVKFRAFTRCEIEELTLPKSVKELGYRAFYQSQIKKIDISECTFLTELGEKAFGDNRGLTEIKLPPNLQTIGAGCFIRCDALVSIGIPASVDVIGDGAFSGCSALVEVRFNDAVTSIGKEAFMNCYSLREVYFPEYVSLIGARAFKNCDSLIEIGIPSADIIDNCAFESCDSLRIVRFPDNCKENETVLKNCYGIIEVYPQLTPWWYKGDEVYEEFPYPMGTWHKKSRITVREDGFGVLYEDGKPYLVGYFGDETLVTLPELIDGVEYGIYSYAFFDSNLVGAQRVIIVSEGVNEIRPNAFYGCEQYVIFDSAGEAVTWTVSQGETNTEISFENEESLKFLSLYRKYKRSR